MILTEKELKYVIVYVYGPRHTCGGYINGERQEKLKEREREKNHTSGRSCMLLKKRGTRSIRVIEPTFLRCLSTVVEYDCEQ